ncbi:MAG: DUF3341 domain-containing protein [Verrucomicrobia bacterium]|jgi:hypothetical protein|nr:DUF3341 domain-containing protein [Verrucomicrobiota bacterium]
MSSTATRLYGLTAQFDSEEKLVEAARMIFASGYRRIDAFSPYPIEGLAEIIGQKRSAAPLIMLIGGITGAVTGYGMELYAMGYFYPLNIGGRPLNSWPLFIPITFELAVLFSALAGMVALLVLNRLPCLYHPLFSVPDFQRASTDQFFLCVESAHPGFDSDHIRELFGRLNAIAITEVRSG